jgi:hypothetical protein
MINGLSEVSAQCVRGETLGGKETEVGTGTNDPSNELKEEEVGTVIVHSNVGDCRPEEERIRISKKRREGSSSRSSTLNSFFLHQPPHVRLLLGFLHSHTTTSCQNPTDPAVLTDLIEEVSHRGVLEKHEKAWDVVSPFLDEYRIDELEHEVMLHHSMDLDLLLELLARRATCCRSGEIDDLDGTHRIRLLVDAQIDSERSRGRHKQREVSMEDARAQSSFPREIEACQSKATARGYVELTLRSLLLQSADGSRTRARAETSDDGLDSS